LGAEIGDEGDDGALRAVGGFEESGFLALVAGGAVSVVGFGFGVAGAVEEEVCGDGDDGDDDDE
jgi:hypothetical protein